MRTIWNGSISFGLVNIPIGLALATQRDDVAFRTLHRECGTPIKQKRWCPYHEREVEPDELVKGWEVAKGEFVVVDEADLESVALQRSQATEVKTAELKLAEQVIESLVGEWIPEDFENDYRRELKAMLDAKLAGEAITRPEPVPETPVVDLMEALRRSVADAQGRRGAATDSKKTKAAPKSHNTSDGGSRRKPAARKSA